MWLHFRAGTVVNILSDTVRDKKEKRLLENSVDGACHSPLEIDLPADVPACGQSIRPPLQAYCNTVSYFDQEVSTVWRKPERKCQEAHYFGGLFVSCVDSYIKYALLFSR